jgi:hypothetical protein
MIKKIACFLSLVYDIGISAWFNETAKESAAASVENPAAVSYAGRRQQRKLEFVFPEMTMSFRI